MREEDIQIFLKAAMHTQCWIFVRDTNKQSLQYVGHPDCAPKPLKCKFKTASANNGFYKTAGLVVSFEIHPNQFKDPDKAKEEWNIDSSKYKLRLADNPRHKPSNGFGIDRDEKSHRYGCLTLDGKYLYGDYDLFDIIKPGHERRNLSSITIGPDGTLGVKSYKHDYVTEFVNKNIGVDMVQHGASSPFSKKFDDVHSFSPDGRYEFLSKAQIEKKFANWSRPTYEALNPNR